MDITILILRTLKEHSSKTKTGTTGPLTRTDLVRKMKLDYPESAAFITSETVRKRLNAIIELENDLPESQKTVCYRTVGGKKTDYYYNNGISDIELKFLIDSVLYSSIFPSPAAQDFAKRIQGLSGKNLENITPYANDSFGRQRYTLDNDILKNLGPILEAKRSEKWIEFDWNVYGVEKGEIKLQFEGRRQGKPYELLLNNGRYFLLLRHEGSEKIYTYSVDLMTNVVLADFKDKIDDNALRKKQNFYKAQYILNHPYMMGGDEERYQLTVKKQFLSRVVNDFSYEMRVVSGTETSETVDVQVKASRKGMLYWLLRNYDIAELADNKDADLAAELEMAVEQLYKKYKKS